MSELVDWSPWFAFLEAETLSRHPDQPFADFEDDAGRLESDGDAE